MTNNNHQPGDAVFFAWPTEAGWKHFAAIVVAARNHPRPKVSLRTSPLLQFLCKPAKGRAVWVTESDVNTTCHPSLLA